MADDAPGMDVDEEEVEQPSSSNVKGDRKRFEVKKVTSKKDSKFSLTNFNTFSFTSLSGMLLLCGLGVKIIFSIKETVKQFLHIP